jgi:hypothetical protein
MEIIMLRKLLVATAALGTFGVIIASPGVVAPRALAAGPKCLNKANKYVACTDKLASKTQRKKSQFDALPKIEGIKGETEARRGPRLRAR